MKTKISRVDNIIEVVAKFYSCPISLIKVGMSSREDESSIRQVAQYYCYHYLNKLGKYNKSIPLNANEKSVSLYTIGDLVGAVKHCTVIYSLQHVADKMETDINFKRSMIDLNNLILKNCDFGTRKTIDRLVTDDVELEALTDKAGIVYYRYETPENVFLFEEKEVVLFVKMYQVLSDKIKSK